MAIQLSRLVDRNRDNVVRRARPLAEVELHVSAHGLPGPPVPGKAVVALHRFGRASAIGLQQRLRHRVVVRQRLLTRVAIGCDGAFDGLFQRRPSGEAVFLRERVLHVPECWGCGGVGKCPFEPRARVGSVGVDRFKPPFRFFLETLETAAPRRGCVHETFLRCT
jgi:hypothetical protein